MGDEHLDTIPSVEYLVPIPRESEGLFDNESECDMPVCDDSSPIFMTDSIFDEFSFPRLPEEHNSENVDTIIESLSYSPIPVEDSDSLIEEIDLFLTSDDSMPPGIESDDYDSEGDFRFLKELLINDSPTLPKNESYNLDSFDNPESPVVKSCFEFESVTAVMNDFDVLNNDESFDLGEGENLNSLNVEEEDSFTFTIRSFLPYHTYPVVLPLSHSTGSEDTIFEPGILNEKSKQVLIGKSSLTLDVFDPLHPPLMDFHVTKALFGFTISLLKLFSKKSFELGIKNATERITRTKRSKNSQKPTRNERDKNKSEETARNQKPDQPDIARKAVKAQNEVKGPRMTSLQSSKAYLEF
ncbi:hypothetical protein Tco_0601352 [Tanacetum coccineum]